VAFEAFSEMLQKLLLLADFMCFNCFMDDDKLIERLEEGVREAEELLRRRKDALAALKGKASGGKKGTRGARGLRPGSIPALALAALKRLKQPASLDELTAFLKTSNTSLDARKVSLALSKYVRTGKYFEVNDEGKYSQK
jgi:hypothetical protein